MSSVEFFNTLRDHSAHAVSGLDRLCLDVLIGFHLHPVIYEHAHSASDHHHENDETDTGRLVLCKCNESGFLGCRELHKGYRREDAEHDADSDPPGGFVLHAQVFICLFYRNLPKDRLLLRGIAGHLSCCLFCHRYGRKLFFQIHIIP